MACSDLLSICEQYSEGVPDIELDLFCSEPAASLDDIWTDPVCSLNSRTSKTLLTSPVPTQSRDAPPNSPVDLAHGQPKQNPYVSHLLRVWSEQTFNSPRLQVYPSSASDTIEVSDGSVLVFEGHDIESYREEEQATQDGGASDQFVPDVEDEANSDGDFTESQGSRILNSCFAGDHTVPVFLEE